MTSLTRRMAMPWLTLSFLALWSSPPEGALERWTELDLRKGFVQMFGRDLDTRISYWSRHMLGTPYRADPLGEGRGSGPDEDPPLTYRAVDCLTYVQTVMALSFSEAPRDVPGYLRVLRYVDGRPTFSSRYYTMVNGWDAGMRNLGILVDETERIGGGRTRFASLDLSRRDRWSPQDRGRFRLLGDLAPRGLARIAYLPPGILLERRTSLPRVALAQVVREPVPESPYLVSHVGWLLRRGDRLIFRHASRSPGRMRVEDRELEEYVESLERFYREHGARKFLGFNVSLVRRPRLHASILLRHLERLRRRPLR